MTTIIVGTDGTPAMCKHMPLSFHDVRPGICVVR